MPDAFKSRALFHPLSASWLNPIAWALTLTFHTLHPVLRLERS